MTRTEVLEKISRTLGVWAEQTKIENQGGLFSKNRITEDLVLPMFRMVFQASGMKNLNTETSNADVIDLVDKRKRLSIQVTTERNAGKITETLEGFFARKYHKTYDRLIFFILDTRKLNNQACSKTKWKKICGRKLKFNPSIDIITIPDLFPLIQGLSDSKVRDICKILSTSVFGEEYIDVGTHLLEQAKSQLKYEVDSGKYVPNIFIESLEIKNLARCFAYPSFFIFRTFDSLRRLNISERNSFFDRMGLPILPFTKESELNIKGGQINKRKIDQIRFNLEKSIELLETFEKIRPSEKPPFKIVKSKQPYYEQNVYHLSYLKYGLTEDIGDLANELNVLNKQVFILTSRAGQGKTNFICDFVENFLFKHKIPCAYLSGRKMSSLGLDDVGIAFDNMIFEDKVKSVPKCLQLLSEHSKKIKKLCVLIIDGINEHHNIAHFSDRIENFINSISKYSNIKLLLTCRSEFFRARFGELLKLAIQEKVFCKEAHFRLFGEQRYDKLIQGYFDYFQIDERLVGEGVINILKKDILLLRFFCEAYGKRGKDKKYKQPRIINIQREQIFELYLKNKIGSASKYMQKVSGKPYARNPKQKLFSVLEHILEFMLQQQKFTDVPISSVPDSLENELFAILDEELILRKDAPPNASVFSASDETLNFTFDEFRDFLLAEYLLKVFYSDENEFNTFVAQNKPENSQILEGIKRFLFYISRRPENEKFLELYKKQAWYSDVYNSEVFNIPIEHLKEADKDLVSKALLKGDYYSNNLARELALNWQSEVNPVLNLELLLSTIAIMDDDIFEKTIVRNFTSNDYSHDPLSADEFCKFFQERILPDFKPEKYLSEDNLVRFLITLMPANKQWDLDSQSYVILSGLIVEHTKFVIELIEEILKYKPRRIRPYIWRLCALVSQRIPRDSILIKEAEKDMKNNATQDNAKFRESSRFLDMVKASRG